MIHDADFIVQIICKIEVDRRREEENGSELRAKEKE